MYGVSRSTTASPQRVWSLWSDPNNWSRWNSGIKAAQLDGPLANGAKGKMTTNRDTTHDVAFSNVVEGRGFSMTMAGPPGATVGVIDSTGRLQLPPEALDLFPQGRAEVRIADGEVTLRPPTDAP